jgi:hypothetical protein
VNLDHADPSAPPPLEQRAQAYTLWLQSAQFGRQSDRARALIRGLLKANPFSTIQVVLDPTKGTTPEAVQREIGPELLGNLMAVCHENPTYLDKFYALQPGRPNGAKRLLLLLPRSWRGQLDSGWVEDTGTWATVVWRSAARADAPEEELEAYEHVWMPG